MPDYSHWSRYWSRGCLTSLPQDFSRNYDGEVAAFWSRQFDALDAGAELLDVCTGNGALALLAAAYSRRVPKALAVTAIDAARVDPQAVSRAHPDAASLMDDIRFVDQTPFEQCSLPSGAYDLVMSQYGIEYCDWSSAATRVHELLRPGGRLVIVAHASESDMIRTMQREAGEFAVLDELRLFDVLGEFAGASMTPAQLHEALERIGPALFQRHRQSASELFRYVLGLADQLLSLRGEPLAGRRSAVADTLAELLAARGRLQDMLRVNEAIAARPDWTREFERAGLERIDSGKLLYGDHHHMGTWHHLEKPLT
ncbi:class I SAM-dependent methyltransferase [Wenzhouxiangella sp. EGI_FJ10409]|uniref:class I SAM-dependent methyltransferase n=1 Tax=Wenzhouxiangella sp. EGI_FJ10409 TaxID=3243767 RepID=UPI0035DE137F